MTTTDNIEWKWLNDEEKYKIYKDGRVYSTIVNKFLKICFSKRYNYLYIVLLVNNKKKTYKFTNLIYETFIEKVDIRLYKIINIDGDINNNKLENLKKIPCGGLKLSKINMNDTKPIPGYEDRYLISKKGEVISLIKGKNRINNRRLKQNATFLKFELRSKEDNAKKYSVHNIIYGVFNNINIDDIENKKYIIEHIDGNNFNNSLDNLRLTTSIKYDEKEDNQWKWLNDEKLYRIYKDGRIYSEIYNKFKKTFISKNSSNRQVILMINGKPSKCSVNKLIFQIFDIHVDNKNQIIHKDGDSTNNHIKNLINIPLKKIRKLAEYDKNIWKPIKHYEDRYVINKDGEIMSLIKGKKLNNNYHFKYDDIYKSHKLINDDGNSKNLSVHRLVYSTFHNIDFEDFNDNVIDHIDRNKLNNKLENLRLVSISENSKNRNKKYITEKRVETKLVDDFKIIDKMIRNYDLSNYEVNSYGQVRKIEKRDKILLSYNTKGYLRIKLKPTNTKKTIGFFIHQLVAHIFIPNPNNFSIVNHLDEIRDNNHVSNLEWTTCRENIIYTCGKKIGQYSLDGNLLNTFRCITDAFTETNKFKKSCISKVCCGSAKTAYGYKWKFLDENNNPI